MRRTSAAVLGCVLLAALAGLARPAAASPPEVFGFGSTDAALGGAVSARVDDFASVHYNPAGLAWSRGKRVAFGVAGHASNLKIDDRRAPISDPLGVVFGLSAPAPLGGPLAGRIVVGIGLYLLPAKVVRVIAHLPDEPFYPWYDNRTQRAVVLPGIAVRVSDKVSIGAALNVLAGLGGQVVAGEGPTRVLEARVDEEIPTNARVNIGLQARPRDTLAFALVYRQAFSVPFTTVADTTVAGEPIDLAIAAEGLYTPHTLVFGTALRTSYVDLSLDASYALWSVYRGPFVTVDSSLPLVGPLAGVLPDVPWKDTVAVRAGVEKVLPTGFGAIALRGGYSFETSPVPAEQPGVTNLLDGEKHGVTTGLGFRIRTSEPGARRSRHVVIDLHLGAQVVGARTLRKQIVEGDGNPFDGLRDEIVDDASEPSTLGVQVSNPGYPSLRSGGQVFFGGLTIGVEL